VTRRKESLARENKATKSGASKPPEVGDLLRQLSVYNEIAARTSHYVGAFTPRAVTHRHRLLMRDDPDVAFGLAILRAPIINLRWSIESKDPAIKAFVEHVLRSRFRQLSMGASLAVPFGSQIIEKVWTSDSLNVAHEIEGARGETKETSYPSAWTIKRFKAIPHESIEIATDEESDDWIGVIQTDTSRKIATIAADRRQVALWAFRRQEVWGDLGGYPILNQVFSPWWDKAFANFAANRYLERKGDPAAKARAGKEVTAAGNRKVDGFRFMSDQIMKLRSAGVITLPSTKDAQGNYTFDFDYLNDDKRADMFQMRIDKLGTQILRGLWITDHAATTGEVGARAEAEVHLDVMSQSIETIIDEYVDELVNPQVVDQIVLFNFGEEALRDSGTRLITSGISTNQRLILKDILIALLNPEQMIGEGKTIPLRDKLDAAAIARDLRVPLKSAEEIEEMMANDEEEKDGAIEVNTGDNDPDAVLMNQEDENAVADQMIRDGILKDDEKEETKPTEEGEPNEDE
jgi:hypothetical protein